MLARVHKPPRRAPSYFGVRPRKSVYLAGSIEMGAAEDWQARLTAELSDLNIDIYNPRRDDWDPSWTQSIDNEPFKQQVLWELQHLDAASVIAMYLDPATRSPISLLELGLYAPDGKLVVCCPDGFWRKGNVDVVCERYTIEHVPTFEQFAEAVGARLQ